MTVVIRLPGIDAPESATFELKSGPKKRSAKSIEGDNGTVGYEGRESSQKYCLAVKDRETGKIELINVPVLDVNSYIKKKREEDMSDLIRQSGVKNWEQRNALGEAFGTKRAKTAISDVARNRVDADQLEDLESVIVDTVKDQTAHLPTQEDRKRAVEALRPIPEPDLETTDVEDVYPVKSIVPMRELDLLAGLVDDLINAETEQSRTELLPFGDSEFVNSRISAVLADKTNVKPRIRQLAYLSVLHGLYENRRVSSKLALVNVLSNEHFSVPTAVVDGLLERFTIARPGHFGRSKDRSFVVDPFHLSKLLCFMLALMLNIDNHTLAVTPLAHALALKPSKVVELFRNLGCSIKPISASQAKDLGLTKTEASTYKVAELRAPVQLPEMIRRKRAN